MPDSDAVLIAEFFADLDRRIEVGRPNAGLLAAMRPGLIAGAVNDPAAFAADVRAFFEERDAR